MAMPEIIENIFANRERQNARFHVTSKAIKYQSASIINTPISTGTYGAFCTCKKYIAIGCVSEFMRTIPIIHCNTFFGRCIARIKRVSEIIVTA